MFLIKKRCVRQEIYTVSRKIQNINYTLNMKCVCMLISGTFRLGCIVFVLYKIVGEDVE